MGDQANSVRRVVLPSGKTIEVVYFQEESAVPEVQAGEPRPVQRPRPLHECPTCDSRLVYPTDWAEEGVQRWYVELRCPDCEWRDSGLFEREVIEDFDAELDRATESLVEDLRRLMRANMEADVERLIRALRADLILPEDF